jgi:hypothetical protein
MLFLPDLRYVIRLPSDATPAVVLEAMRSERVYGVIAMLIGALVTVAGIVMIFLNIGGQVDITLNLSGHDSKINTAVVGIPVILVGLAIIVMTRPKVIVSDPVAKKSKKAPEH